MKEQSYQRRFAVKDDHKLNRNRHWPSHKSISLQDHLSLTKPIAISLPSQKLSVPSSFRGLAVEEQ